MVLAWLPFSDSRNHPCDSPVRAVASVGEVNPHLHGIVLQECWGASDLLRLMEPESRLGRLAPKPLGGG